MEKLISNEEEQAVIEAIRRAEANTSGEIRVHLQRRAKEESSVAALKVFHKLKMDQTQLRNAVLVLLLIEQRRFVILGDKGINEVVPAGFWDETRDMMGGYFREGHIAEGLCAGIEHVGEKLKIFFPASDENPNELSDELSYDHT